MPIKRWITGLAALPFLLFLIFEGGLPFYALVAAAAVVALYEFHGILFARSGRSPFGPVTLTGMISAPIILWAAHQGSPEWVVGLSCLDLMFAGLMSILRFKPDGTGAEPVLARATGVVYIVLPLAMLVLIRGQADGATWIILILAIVFVGDTSAYHVGSAWGRHKLCPSVSPGKTVQGAVGGLAGNLVAGAVVKHFFLPDLPWAESLMFFIVIGAAGQIGDLFESQFKRLGGVKDSGVILPGHGGILDRIDALLFAAPVAYLFRQLMAP
jgi:phosphatidate cytidylyltransferase